MFKSLATALGLGQQRLKNLDDDMASKMALDNADLFQDVRISEASAKMEDLRGRLAKAKIAQQEDREKDQTAQRLADDLQARFDGLLTDARGLEQGTDEFTRVHGWLSGLAPKLKSAQVALETELANNATVDGMVEALQKAYDAQVRRVDELKKGKADFVGKVATLKAKTDLADLEAEMAGLMDDSTGVNADAILADAETALAERMAELDLKEAERGEGDELAAIDAYLKGEASDAADASGDPLAAFADLASGKKPKKK